MGCGCTIQDRDIGVVARPNNEPVRLLKALVGRRSLLSTFRPPPSVKPCAEFGTASTTI